MNKETDLLTDRQLVRMGILENIAFGIMFAPYIVVTAGSKMHLVGLLIGVVFVICYGLLIYGFSRLFGEGYIKAIEENTGKFAAAIDIIYIIRFVFKAAIIITIFSKLIQNYMLKSYGLIYLIIPFVLVCGYGSGRSLKMRGRLFEFLFWWMILPLIFVAVLSITNVDIGRFMFPRLINEEVSLRGIFYAGYGVLLAESSMEMLLLSLNKEKSVGLKSIIKIVSWILVSIVFSYVLVVGVLGERWVSQGKGTLINVVQSIILADGAIKRLDYLVFAFWIIGIFAVSSGYIFCAKQFAASMLSLKKQGQKSVAGVVLSLITLAACVSFLSPLVSKYAMEYLIYFDIFISILLPGIVYLAMKLPNKMRFKKWAVVGGFIALSSFVTCINIKRKPLNSDSYINMVSVKSFVLPVDAKPLSLEKRSYVTNIFIEKNKRSYSFSFNVADLTDYKGSEKGQLAEKEYIAKADGINKAIKKIEGEEEIALDLGHINKIFITGKPGEYKEIFVELSAIAEVNKQLTVVDDKKQKYKLADLIASSF